MSRSLLVCLSAIVVATSVRGQAFTNLNFESAQVVITTNIGGSPFITVASALPDWSAYSGTNQLSLVEYNPNPAGVPFSVNLVGSNADVIDGNFSVLLGDHTGSISQSGVIPNGTRSLIFDATSSSFVVSLGGVNLSYEPISAGTNSYGLNYSIYAADISGFAGQEETLTFSMPVGYELGLLDNIQFSPETVPEPSALALFSFAGGVLVALRSRRRAAPVKFKPPGIGVVAKTIRHAAARLNRSAMPCHSGDSGGASTTIHSAPASSQRCNSA